MLQLARRENKVKEVDEQLGQILYSDSSQGVLDLRNEFAYIRTIYPRGAAEEDGFIYLSDPFMRNTVGPQLKLTERRRMLCYNHLRMIGNAAMLYRTEHGKTADSLETLFESKCCPAPFHTPKSSMAATKIARWITDLDSDQFAT